MAQKRATGIWRLARAALAAMIFSATAVALTGADLRPDGELSTPAVTATGRGEALLRIHRLGRYALRVASDQGVALQLVDRMAGPSAWAGKAGESDGRLDRFLEPGEYKLRTRGHPDGSGEATLLVQRYRELNAPAAPRLVEFKQISTSVGDVEQRSYWLLIKESKWVALEAAGRHLSDLRLWRDGGWLVDSAPHCEVVDPRPGRPLLDCRLTLQLDPGAYLVTAYGGPGQPWAEESAEQPLYIRWGIPTLGRVGRRWRRMSPFGVDRFLIPRSATLYRLELPEALPAELAVGVYSPATALETPPLRAGLDKKHHEPAVELQTSAFPEGRNVVVVRAAAGQPYVLQHFDLRRWYQLPSSRLWLSAVSTGDPQDSAEATGIMVCTHYDRRQIRIEPDASFVVGLDSGHGWRRRCNLLDPLTMFFRVHEKAAYRVTLDGVKGTYRFEPFTISRPAKYRQPADRSSGSSWELDRGFWVLTVTPTERGIMTVTIAADGESPPAEESPRTLLRDPKTQLGGWPCTVYLNSRPGVKTGLVMRDLPVDLAEPLPLTLQPGEVVAMSVRVSEPGAIRAVTDDGRPLELQRPGRGWLKRLVERPGTYDLRVRLPEGAPAVTAASVFFEPKRLADTTPLPPLPDAERPPLPDFPVVAERAPRYLDLARGGSATLSVFAAKGALYRLESTGLLDTQGTLRSRTVTALARSNSGGSGRNFLLQQYLRRGKYQLVTAARGRSQGHLGVRLARYPLRDGGGLADGVPARIVANEGEGIAYRFRVERQGRYAIDAQHRGGVLDCRLEDGDGWPVIAPGVPAALNLKLDPGDYRLIVLPTPAAGRRVTTLRRIPEPPAFTGHGPHQLPLGQRVENLWTEPVAEGTARPPDRWRFTVPAASPVRVRLDSGMEGEIVRLDGAGGPVAAVPVRSGWRGVLEAGRYELEARSHRRNNRVRYGLEVDPEALISGTRRPVDAPAKIPVAVAGGHLVEIGSAGPQDVSARLLDAGGREVARSDDRPGDWNFLISRRLPAGTYTLEIAPVGAEEARTIVEMLERPGTAGEPLPLGAARELDLGAAVEAVPLPALRPAGVLVVRAAGSETLGLAVDVATPDGSWRAVGVERGGTPLLLIPGLGEGRYRARVWSVDRRGGPVRLSARMVAPVHLSERELAHGTKLGNGGTEGALPAVVEVALDGPGVLRTPSGTTGLLASAEPGVPFAPVSQGLVTGRSNRLWLAAPPGVRFQAERVVLSVQGAGRAEIRIPVAADAPVVLDVDGAGPMAAIAEAPAGRVGVRWLERDAGRAKLGWPIPVGVGARASVALRTARRPGRLLLWSLDGREVPSARIRVRKLAAGRAVAAAPGVREGTVPAGAMVRLRLPGEAAGLVLGVGPGVLATVVGAPRPAPPLWGGRDGRQATLTGGDELVLAVPGGKAGRYRLETLPAAPSRQTVAAGRPFEAYLTRAGRLRLPVADDGNDRLHVAGAVTSWSLLTLSGRLVDGAAVAAAPERGIAIIDHGPGLVAVWIGEPWRRGDTGATAVDLPASLALSGREQVVAVRVPRPTLVTVRHGGPAVVGLDAPGSEVAGWLDPAGAVRHLLLPAGESTLGVRGVAGAGLAGRLELAPVPTVETGEGLGDPVLLSPGSAAAFTFEVPDRRKVGLGARAEAEVVRCRLFAPDGRLLDSGTLLFDELEPGRYVLEVSCPTAALPVWVRPVVVGLQNPGTGPPEKILQSYLHDGRGGGR